MVEHDGSLFGGVIIHLLHRSKKCNNFAVFKGLLYPHETIYTLHIPQSNNVINNNKQNFRL